MAHLFETGFKVRTASWHAKELVVASYPESKEAALALSGLATWEPEVVSSFYIKAAENLAVDDVVLTTLPDGRIVVEDVSGRKVIRTDSQKVLGSGVSTGYTPVLNSVMADVAEALVDSGDGKLLFETMGSLDEGRKVYCTVMLDEPWVIGDDDTMVTYPFLAITNAHDGSGSFYAQPSTFEVVCANTAKLAEIRGERIGRQFKFNHTGNVMDRIEEAKSALAGLRTEAAHIHRISEALYACEIDDAAVVTFADMFAPTHVPNEEGATSRVRGNAIKAADALIRCYEESPTIDGHRGTALGLARAGTEFLDHIRKARTATTYAYRNLLAVEPLKGQAYRIAAKIGGLDFDALVAN